MYLDFSLLFMVQFYNSIIFSNSKFENIAVLFFSFNYATFIAFSQCSKALAIGLILCVLAKQMTISMKSIHLFFKIQPLHNLHLSKQAQLCKTVTLCNIPHSKPTTKKQF